MKFGFVFPGQGSQAVGMMNAYGAHPLIRRTFEEAADAISTNLWRMVESGTAEELALTVNTQPLMLTAGIAVWRMWRACDKPVPNVMAGHSLGEYSALVAAGVVDFAQAVKLVHFRAQAMQEAVPAGVGAMAAILNLDVREVEAACEEAAQGQVVACANLNDPRQIVIAGHKEAVERACEIAKQKGAKRALLLPVSAPFHCALMRPASERLADYLQDIKFAPPAIPVINNVDVKTIEDVTQIKQALVRQAYSPVRWIETIQTMHAMGTERIYECGPGKVLAGLVKRIDTELEVVALVDEASVSA